MALESAAEDEKNNYLNVKTNSKNTWMVVKSHFFHVIL